ncbi:hypothetical protein [Shimia sp. SDUM112013]|uniref:tetratricopeptide repeat protein n=1 Tax=Shimia sp. SDUM112013 TaxID=3136160 RepID=UPI0032EFCA74
MVEKPSKGDPAKEQVREALAAVLASQIFATSPRLVEFLTFVVEETLAGHSAGINGKVIAIEVYQREIDEAGSAQNLVRVEARRLRRALDEYYSSEGQSDPMRIHMDTGGYRPRFERVTPSQGESPPLQDARPAPVAARTGMRSVGLGLSVVAVLGLIGGLALWFSIPRPAETNFQTTQAARSAELAALRERSMASIQAANIADQARGMFFPLFDLKRQTIALESFRHAIDLDANLPAGYAGAAQVLALLSYLTADPEEASALLTEARDMAERAVALGPTDSWAQAAHGWTLAVEGDLEGALRHARIAKNLSPEDGHVLDLVGITALLSNEPELMAEVSAPARSRAGEGRFGANNIWGASQIMLQNYPVAIETFSNAAERGHPVSAPSLFLLATAYHETGDEDAARKLIDEMYATWPDFQAEAVVSLFFKRDPETRSRVLATLGAYKSDQD